MPNKPLRLTIEPHGFDILLRNLLPNIGGKHKRFVEMLESLIDHDQEWVFPIYVNEDYLTIEFHIENKSQKLFLQELQSYLVDLELYELAQIVNNRLMADKMPIL
ncbi:hypothetical protein [Carboxylicivirga sp. M1479]|uniref:hypothetical protein n=1 Tax=Carboxylicivirga sp. M1479 TaxID=2594476 RepID=UPI001178BB2D|nr:hypothetical protein [Carboxylicivirga sp. M1479]TRX72558.1 hypothetical protein FNN09_01060 [Carboxylicivirga sp. M1479]